jgi:tmRNA-binding protein
MNERIKELEHQLYLSDFRIKKYNRNNEFDAAEREEYEKMLINKELNELKAKL